MNVFNIIPFLVYSMFELHRAYASIDDQFRTFMESGKAIRDNTKQLRKTIRDLGIDFEKMYYRVQNLKQYVNDIDGYNRVDNLEILGITKTEGEDLMEVLKNLSLALNVSFSPLDISSVWRTHEVSGANYYKKTERDSVVVRFVSRTVRNKWLVNGRNKRVIKSKECLPELPESDIYINEHLTNLKKSLIKTAKKLEEEQKIQYAWIKDGNLYIRRTPGGKAIKVKSMHDFHLLGLVG